MSAAPAHSRRLQGNQVRWNGDVIGLLGGVGPTIDPLPVLFRALRLEGVRVGSITHVRDDEPGARGAPHRARHRRSAPHRACSGRTREARLGKHFGKIVVARRLSAVGRGKRRHRFTGSSAVQPGTATVRLGPDPRAPPEHANSRAATEILTTWRAR